MSLPTDALLLAQWQAGKKQRNVRQGACSEGNNVHYKAKLTLPVPTETSGCGYISFVFAQANPK